MVIEHPEQYTGWTAAAFGSAPGIRADRRGRGARQLLRARCAALLSFLATASRAWRGEVLRKPGQRANSGPPCVFLGRAFSSRGPAAFSGEDQRYDTGPHYQQGGRARDDDNLLGLYREP
jgi:hypothetical protein